MITWRNPTTTIVNLLRLVTWPIGIVDNHHILLVGRARRPLATFVGVVRVTGRVGALAEDALMTNTVPAKAELVTVSLGIGKTLQEQKVSNGLKFHVF